MPPATDNARLRKMRLARIPGSFLHVRKGAVSARLNKPQTCQINETREGSTQTTKCEAVPLSSASPAGHEKRRSVALLHLADLLHRRDQARRVFRDEFGKFRRV